MSFKPQFNPSLKLGHSHEGTARCLPVTACRDPKIRSVCYTRLSARSRDAKAGMKEVRSKHGNLKAIKNKVYLGAKF